jgi:hypothetical protein
MALRYQTGQEIHPADRVTYGGNAGTVELVVEALTGKSEEDWLLLLRELNKPMARDVVQSMASTGGKGCGRRRHRLVRWLRPRVPNNATARYA